MTGGQDGRRPPASYQIRVRGRLGATTLRAFPALHAETRDGDTLLRGGITDQAALHGVLAQIEALGLELIEVRHLPTRHRPAKAPGRVTPNHLAEREA